LTLRQTRYGSQIRSSVNSHRKLLTKVQIKLADGKGLFFYY
jgi:hypothetical protein